MANLLQFLKHFTLSMSSDIPITGDIINKEKALVEIEKTLRNPDKILLRDLVMECRRFEQVYKEYYAEMKKREASNSHLSGKPSGEINHQTNRNQPKRTPKFNTEQAQTQPNYHKGPSYQSNNRGPRQPYQNEKRTAPTANTNSTTVAKSTEWSKLTQTQLQKSEPKEPEQPQQPQQPPKPQPHTAPKPQPENPPSETKPAPIPVQPKAVEQPPAKPEEPVQPPKVEPAPAPKESVLYLPTSLSSIKAPISLFGIFGGPIHEKAPEASSPAKPKVELSEVESHECLNAPVEQSHHETKEVQSLPEEAPQQQIPQPNQAQPQAPPQQIGYTFQYPPYHLYPQSFQPSVKQMQPGPVDAAPMPPQYQPVHQPGMTSLEGEAQPVYPPMYPPFYIPYPATIPPYPQAGGIPFGFQPVQNVANLPPQQVQPQPSQPQPQ